MFIDYKQVSKNAAEGKARDTSLVSTHRTHMQRFWVSLLTSTNHLCAIAGKADEGPKHPTQYTSFCSRELATNSCYFLSKQPADLHILQKQKATHALPLLWLQELHNCHLLPKQLSAPERKQKIDPLIQRSRASIKWQDISITLALSLKSVILCKLSLTYHAAPKQMLVSHCVALFLQTLHYIAPSLPPHCQTLQYLALHDTSCSLQSSGFH